MACRAHAAPHEADRRRVVDHHHGIVRIGPSRKLPRLRSSRSIEKTPSVAIIDSGGCFGLFQLLLQVAMSLLR